MPCPICQGGIIHEKWCPGNEGRGQDRNAIIEECARVAEMWDFQSKDPVTGDSIADAIRALKEKP